MNNSDFQDTSYNIENYTVKELLTIFKKFFKLDFEHINNELDLIKILNININNYKNSYNNQDKIILFFENATKKINEYLLLRPYSLKYLIVDNDNHDYLNLTDNQNNDNINDNNENDENDNDNDDNDNDKLNIIKYDSNEYNEINYEDNKLPNNINELNKQHLIKLYDIFKIQFNNLSTDTLEESYTSLKNKIINLNNKTKNYHDKKNILQYINNAYNLLRKYIINKLYLNEFNKTNFKILNNDNNDNNDLTFNENRYNELFNKKKENTNQEVFINEFPKDYLNPIKRIEIKSIVNIDTFLRSDYLNTNPSDYVQEFAEPINNVLSMALSSIEMPNIWYTFSNERNSNYFNIEFKNFNYNGNVYDVSYDIIIPNGNYTTVEITTTLNNLFKYYAQNNKQIGNEFANPIYYLRYAVDNITGKSTFRIISSGYDYTSTDEEELFGTSPYEEYKFDTETLNPIYSPDMIIEFNFLNSVQKSLYDNIYNRKYDASRNEIVYNLNNINNTLNEYYVRNTKKKAYNANTLAPERIMFDTAGWMLGFRKPKYSIKINDTFFDPYTSGLVVIYKGFLNSEGIYGGLINTYIFLSIDDFNNNYKRTVISNNEDFLVSNNILAKIPIGTGSNTLLVQEDKINKLRQYFGPVNIKKIRIKLLDRFGNIIDLNNNNYTFTLELTQLY